MRPVFFWSIFKNIEDNEDLIRTLVRKNRRERFLTLATFANGPKGEGRESPSNPSVNLKRIVKVPQFFLGHLH